MKLFIILVSAAVLAVFVLALPSASASVKADSATLNDAENVALSRDRRAVCIRWYCYWYYGYRCFYYYYYCSGKRSVDSMEDIPHGNATSDEVFNFLDRDNDGYISVCEWTMADHGELFDFIRFIENEDVSDGDDMISLAEFKLIPMEMHKGPPPKVSNDKDFASESKNRKTGDEIGEKEGAE